MDKKQEAAERVEEWKQLIEDCKNRPVEMGMDEWCRSVGVSKTNYYYWHRKLGGTTQKQKEQTKALEIVRVSDVLTEDSGNSMAGLDIEIGRVRIHVTEHTPVELLRKVLKVAAYAE